MNEQKSQGESLARYVTGTLKWMNKNIGEHMLSLIVGNANDWTCIVTIHAMIETGLSNALAKQFQSPELSSVLAKLAMSNASTGKIAFAKALKILDPKTIKFIRKLSELRNLCVHDVRNFSFDLNKHVAGLSKKKRNKLMNPILQMVEPERRTKFTPKDALFVGTFCIMGELYIHELGCENRDLNAKVRERHAQLFQEMEKKALATTSDKSS